MKWLQGFVLFDKTDLFQEGIGQTGMEKVRSQINNTKQVKGTRTTVPKKMLTIL